MKRDTTKEKTDMVVKRYGKTTKGTAEKPKFKIKAKPIIRKNKIGVNIKATF